MSYKTIRINDICLKVTSGGTPRSTNAEFYSPEEIPWLKTGEVNFCRIYDTETYISKEGLARSSAKLIPENSVIIAMYGQGDTAGRVAINKIPLSTNQACCNLIINHKIADYEYVYYALSTLYDKFVSLKNGGAQPNLNAGIIKKVEIPFPEFVTQKKISSILSNYDYLIKNNQDQIRLLEESAQRLYKEWFINLHFPGHEDMEIVDGVPESWKKVPLTEIAPIITGKKDANFGTENGQYLFFTCAQEPIKAPSYSFDCDAVILAGNGDFNVKLYRGKFEAYQRTYVFSPYDLNNLYLLYYAVKDNMRQLFQGASGSTIKFLTKRMLEEIMVYIPDGNTLKIFINYCESYQKKIEILKHQIAVAKESRDRLLTKLMSGEIEV
jgi:type I restriction-modification system specificity subunit